MTEQPGNAELLAALAHELRNPLHAIAGWASILSRVPDLPERVMHGLGAIERNSKLQARMIADMLDYAGLSSGRSQLTVENIDPWPALRAAVEGVSVSAQASGVHIRTELTEQVLRVAADAARLQQMVESLLVNAVGFSPQGSEVLLQAGADGDTFFVRVTHAGVTVDAKAHDGVNLGLLIAARLVELQGGTMQALSAACRFTLPLADSAAL